MRRSDRRLPWPNLLLVCLLIVISACNAPLEPVDAPETTATPLIITAATADSPTAVPATERPEDVIAALTPTTAPADVATSTVAPTPSAAAIITPTATPLPEPQIITYTVKSGDTLWSIATEFVTDVETISRLNDILNEDALFVGQQLLVPQGATVADIDPDLVPAPAVPRSEIGYSVNGHPIYAYTVGDGPADVAIVGAIHGGYEWNSALLAFELLDHFAANPDLVPENITLHFIPVANPDGLAKVVGTTGRFTPSMAPADIDDTAIGRTNGADVDLNRNWDCEWTDTAEWRYGPISPGSGPFSEPETRALRDYLYTERPDSMRLVILLHSSAGLVVPGRCGVDNAHAPSEAASRTYAGAAGIYLVQYFTAYAVTGDASDWLARQGVAALTVELTTHEAVEFEANLAGTLAVLEEISAAEPAAAPTEQPPPYP